jgi:hypothetical protein
MDSDVKSKSSSREYLNLVSIAKAKEPISLDLNPTPKGIVNDFLLS